MCPAAGHPGLGGNVKRKLRIGGIGGLTAARALLRRGLAVHVYESSPELKEIGAGVALGPNAMKALRSLDLEAPVRAIGYESGLQHLRTWKGRVISSTDATVSARRFGASGCTIHRADLLDVLARSVPADIVSLSARCEGVTTGDDGAAARFTGGMEVEADVIVGADGIHSAVRASLFGPDAPQFTGKICYRSVIPVADLPARRLEPYEGLWLGPHGTIVNYGVRRGELINVVAHYEDATYKHESWIAECDREEILERYHRWHPSLREVFEAGKLWHKWALYDRDPIPAWSTGRTTILGDAALPRPGRRAGHRGRLRPRRCSGQAERRSVRRAAALRAFASAAREPGSADLPRTRRRYRAGRGLDRRVRCRIPGGARGVTATRAVGPAHRGVRVGYP